MEISIRSKRDTDIPASVYEGNGSGLLLLAHSFKSDRFENGRFDAVAERMRRCGWNVVSLDFPGNGESREPFLDYTLKNCLDDMESAYSYMKEQYPVDENKVALLGYSMGGRLISLFLDSHPEINELVFWAACVQPYSMNDRFLEQELSKLKKDCKGKGYCDFHDIYEDVHERMSETLIDDLTGRNALKPLESFEGRALIIQGDKDATIDIKNADLIFDHLKRAKQRKLFWMEGADHGFGLWDSRAEDSERLVETTCAFLNGEGI